jgi:hypothetical protein
MYRYGTFFVVHQLLGAPERPKKSNLATTF